jgi:hypothetical protein
MTLLFNDNLYMMVSEIEVDHGYADLALILRPDARKYQALDLLLEFKYLGLKELGLSGEQLRQLSHEQLAALPWSRWDWNGWCGGGYIKPGLRLRKADNPVRARLLCSAPSPRPVTAFCANAPPEPPARPCCNYRDHCPVFR